MHRISDMMIGATNLVDLGATSVTRFATRPLFGERRGDTWSWMSYATWQAEVDALRAGLFTLAIVPGDRVAIISRNSSAWATAAYASYGVGATFVPMYEMQRPDDWEFILRDCGATVVFARTPEIATALAAMRPRLPGLRHIITIEGDPDDPDTFAALQALGRARPRAPHRPAPEDIAGLIYTSGTTGKPKGVILTHANLTSNVAATVAAFPIGADDRTVSFLPWAHVYGQTCELHILVAVGASTAFNTETEHLLDDLRDVRPTILVAVPRIFNRLHAAVRAQIEKRPRPIRRLFWNGMRASIRRRAGEHLGLWDRIVCSLAGILFAAVRRKLGGRLRYAITASATLSRDVAQFIDGLGIEVYEGYGLSETSPVVAMNRPGQRKLGSVGLPITDVRIELDLARGAAPGEGEIVVHGPNVMRGYHDRPDENAHAFTDDHGLRTGDLGQIDSDGYLFITGRIKEQYKLENGKYVMPSPLEERLALSPYIRNVMLYGADRPYNVVLVVIDPDAIRHWAAEHHVVLGADVTRDPQVRTLIHGELARNAAELRGYERPVDFALTDTPFAVENGLLTPTLKLKRREVLARFGAILYDLYVHPPGEVIPRITPDTGRMEIAPAVTRPEMHSSAH